MSRRYLTAWICLVVVSQAFSQELSLFEKKSYTSPEGQVLPYRILYPESFDKTKKYPLVLFLHGAGERGNDNEKQLVHGAKLFLADANRKQYPAIIIFPQCPSENFWSTVKVDNTKTPREFTFDYTRKSNWPLVSAIEVVKQVIAAGSVDKKKVYIAGLSMGGMGTFEAMYFYPKMFAAALPICGGGDATRYDKRIKKTSFWIFHGAVDAVVDVKYSRQMVERLKQLKTDVRYSEYPDVNHNSWDNAFAEPDFMKWMFDHKK